MQVVTPCPYEIDGCVLENEEIGPCLCVNPVSRPQPQCPSEPTKEMALAGRKALAIVADRMEEAKLLATSSIDFWQRVGHEPANEIYKAMIEASPAADQKIEKLVAALSAMVDRWEPDCDGQDRVMWENAKEALEFANGDSK